MTEVQLTDQNRLQHFLNFIKTLDIHTYIYILGETDQIYFLRSKSAMLIVILRILK